MGLPLTLMTELEAVNKILEIIGEAPISSLPSSGVSEAYIARTMLHNQSRMLQEEGCSFNTDENYRVTPDVNGHVVIPTNALRFDASLMSEPYVIRLDVNDQKLKLYNTAQHSFVFFGDVTVDVVWFFPWEGMPGHARTLVWTKAAREFQKKFNGSEFVHEVTAEDEVRARAAFMSAEERQIDRTILTSPGVFRVVNRRV